MHLPRVYHELSSDRVLTMEFARGLPVADPDALRAARIEPAAVAQLVARVRTVLCNHPPACLSDAYLCAREFIRTLEGGRPLFVDHDGT